jgi:hypothetical protein
MHESSSHLDLAKEREVNATLRELQIPESSSRTAPRRSPPLIALCG